jgi:hypothetical protein
MFKWPIDMRWIKENVVSRSRHIRFFENVCTERYVLVWGTRILDRGKTRNAVALRDEKFLSLITGTTIALTGGYCNHNVGDWCRPGESWQSP